MSRHEIYVRGLSPDDVANRVLDWLRATFPEWVGSGPAFDSQRSEEFVAYLGPGNHIEATQTVETSRIGSSTVGLRIWRTVEHWRTWNPEKIEDRPAAWLIESDGWPTGSFRVRIDEWEAIFGWDVESGALSPESLESIVRGGVS